MQQAQVLFSEEISTNGKKIGIAQLNSPKSLNALNLAMVELLIEQVTHWQNDQNISVIVLSGTGDKAFCAGGDVVSIYHEILAAQKVSANQKLSDSEIKAFAGVEYFTKEYQLDLLIHQSTKPILVWADGYVMGGGIGLMAGASHKVVTEKTLMAMPEVTIGLYPDVGASWFLNQMPKGVGLFLGLTGMTFNGADAKIIKLANHQVKSTDKQLILTALNTVDWQKNNEENHHLLSQLLNTYETKFEEQHSNISEHLATIDKTTSANDIETIYHDIISKNIDSVWFNKAQQKIKHGSPLSLHLIYHQLNKCTGLSLQECFEQELNLSSRCCQHTEFVEGVRALLVDKDKQPQWKYSQIDEVDLTEVEWFFSLIS
ncbi:enoyl-CoA hydratase/isomerase family protein [Thalassotalea profundi]|uniref:3-hydroxyisobutyryl-CoA hydrolase n=1 Tax=Thalassotalea profundi TaxID=2036687 RepID=A0ABQ3IDJ6_9GAMM|nr:enoyl-CoA hydratase/isomerase family protein [Thalassotalea profundi]GHE79392.1 enoyl-CoA hydratase [Thalassotalea profundi]